jgi:hypothetical protein
VSVRESVPFEIPATTGEYVTPNMQLEVGVNVNGVPEHAPAPVPVYVNGPEVDTELTVKFDVPVLVSCVYDGPLVVPTA